MSCPIVVLLCEVTLHDSNNNDDDEYDDNDFSQIHHTFNLKPDSHALAT